jgi:hypothetical protein
VWKLFRVFQKYFAVLFSRYFCHHINWLLSSQCAAAVSYAGKVRTEIWRIKWSFRTQRGINVSPVPHQSRAIAARGTERNPVSTTPDYHATTSTSDSPYGGFYEAAE